MPQRLLLMLAGSLGFVLDSGTNGCHAGALTCMMKCGICPYDRVTLATELFKKPGSPFPLSWFRCPKLMNYGIRVSPR